MIQGSTVLGDGDEFRQIFFEEAQEHLDTMEAILLRLDSEAPNPDDLNAIFRAAHSIKGSAAMLGYTEIATLTHVLENLLDLLRKEERPITKVDVDAMLKAGDIVKLQIAHRRGLRADTPAAGQAETALRARVAFGAIGVGNDASGARKPSSRSFSVRLGPLEPPIGGSELDMMLTGLAEMGTLKNQDIYNTPGGHVSFDVTLEGTEMDLRSILSLVVAPEQIAIEKLAALDTTASAPANTTPLSTALRPALPEDDEVFVDPAAFRRRKPVEPEAMIPQAPTPGTVDVFVTPESLKSARRQQLTNAVADPATAPNNVKRRATDTTSNDTSSIRVSIEKIDALVNLAGELVITEAMLAREAAVGQAQGLHADSSGLADLARHTRNLQEAVLAIRMVPISNVFSRFPRLIRELSERMGKRVELRTVGESTELDRGLIEKISDPLTHLVRNSIDHGLESASERIAAGKPPVGTITLAASQRGGKIFIEVTDDGRGLNRARILEKAAARGMVMAPDAPDSDVWQLIFEAGFSTAEKITDVSGRGVGMDVVKRNIQSLGGVVELSSTEGQGATVSVSVPLTLAIMEAMTVSIGGEIYVLPLASVVESRHLAEHAVHVLPGQGETLRVRDDYLPVLRLADLFPPRQRNEHAANIAVIVETNGGHAAVVVDELVGQQQVVVKSLETNFYKVPGLSGATILGDGSVALILDVGYLINLTARSGASSAAMH